MHRISKTVTCNIIPETMIGELDYVFDYRKKCELIAGADLYTQFAYPSTVSYYFTDNETLNSEYTIIDGNNIGLPIQHRFSPNVNIRLKKFLRELDNDKTWYLNKGVYILTYYHIPITSFNKIQDNLSNRDRANYALEHLISNSSVLSYYSNLKDELLELLNDHYLKVTRDGRDRLYTEFSFRLMTFVSRDEIVKYGKVYIPGFNLIVAYGEIEKDYKHPSDMFVEKVNKPIITLSSGVEYVILKHDPSVNERRFVKIGSNIIPISVKRVNGLELEGCYKYEIINGVTASKPEYCTLDEMEEKFGIYKTIEECEYNGNKELVLDGLKYQHQKDKLILDNKKLNLEDDKLVYENKKLKHDKKMLKLAKKTEMRLMSMKLEMEVIKYNNALLGADVKKDKDMIDTISSIISTTKNLSGLISLI